MAKKMTPIPVGQMPEDQMDDSDTESSLGTSDLPELEETGAVLDAEEEAEPAEPAEPTEPAAPDAPEGPLPNPADFTAEKERALMTFARALMDHAATDRPSFQDVERAFKAWDDLAGAEDTARHERSVAFAEAYDEPQKVREANYRTFVQDREAILRRWAGATRGERQEISRELMALPVPETIRDGVMRQALFTHTAMK